MLLRALGCIDPRIATIAIKPQVGPHWIECLGPGRDRGTHRTELGGRMGGDHPPAPRICSR